MVLCVTKFDLLTSIPCSILCSCVPVFTVTQLKATRLCNQLALSFPVEQLKSAVLIRLHSWDDPLYYKLCNQAAVGYLCSTVLGVLLSVLDGAVVVTQQTSTS